MKPNGMNLSNTAIKKRVKNIRDILGIIGVIGSNFPGIQEKIESMGGEKAITKSMLEHARYEITLLLSEL